MDVERVVAERLSEAVGVDAYLEPPEDTPEEHVVVEQVGGGGSFLEPVQLDVDCLAPRKARKRARALARAVEAAVPDLDEEPNLFGPEVLNVYRMNDPDTGRARYVVQLQAWVCE